MGVRADPRQPPYPKNCRALMTAFHPILAAPRLSRRPNRPKADRQVSGRKAVGQEAPQLRTFVDH